MTVGDLIALAMKEIGVLQVGETPSSEEYFDGLWHLNLMLDSWRTERLMAYRIVRSEVDLTAGVGYVEPSPRPVRIERAGFLDFANTASPDEVPVHVANVQEWAAISYKAQQERYPCEVYYDPIHPTGRVMIYPVPSVSSPEVKLVLYTWQPLTGYADAPDAVEATLASAVSYPPGYQMAILKCLAVQIAPSFNVQPSPLLIEQMLEAKGRVKSLNIGPSYMVSDGFFSGGRYDIRSDRIV